VKLQNSSNQHAPPVRSGPAGLSAKHIRALAGAAVIIAAVFLAYQQSINGGFLLDDDLILTENPNIKATDGMYRFWCTAKEQDYWPLTYSTLWFEWRLWGRNSTGYHVTSLMLHILESLLVWIILRRLFIPGAFLAALIFAVHPVNVESVAWISELKNTMAMLFFLMSILWYLRSTRSHGGPWEQVKRAPRPTFRRYPAAAKQYTTPCLPSAVCNLRWYWLSLATFALAMFGKGSVAVLPVMLLEITWWLRTLENKETGLLPYGASGENAPSNDAPAALFSLIKSDLLQTGPFFVIAALLAGVNVWFQTHGTDIVFRSANFTERLLGAGCVVWFYLYEALFPVDLYFIYPMWHIQSDNFLWWLPLIASLAVTAVLWLYRKTWAGPLLFAWIFFCVALAPVAGFTDIGFMRFALVADRYQHIAIIGLIALLAAGWHYWHRRARSEIYWAATSAAVLAVGSLTFLAWRQNGIYVDEVTLYRATLKKNPACWMVHNNLGFILASTAHSQKAIDEAIDHFQKAVKINPEYEAAQNNLGNLLTKAGRLKEAEDHLRQAMRIKPNYVDAMLNLGDILLKTGRPQEAEEILRKVVLLKPDSPDPLNAMGKLLLTTNRPREAADLFRQALALKPNDVDLNNNIGVALMQMGRFYEAIEHYRQALRQKPDFADGYFNLAVVNARLNRPSESLASAQMALNLARAQGQTELARQIENWLNSYRAGLSSPSSKPAPAKSTSPP
jgi:protein O-mannosyl-transferase